MLKKNKYEEHGSDFENKISKIDKKVPDISSLVKKTEYNKLFTKVNNIDTTDFVKKKTIMLLNLLQLKMNMSLMQH